MVWASEHPKKKTDPIHLCLKGEIDENFRFLKRKSPRKKTPFGRGVRQAARPVAKLAMAAAERSKTFQDLSRGQESKGRGISVVVT